MFYVYAESTDGTPTDTMEEYVNLVKALIDDQAVLSS
jgi:hypothetical protein